jgi:hypothetical protein
MHARKVPLNRATFQYSQYCTGDRGTKGWALPAWLAGHRHRHRALLRSTLLVALLGAATASTLPRITTSHMGDRHVLDLTADSEDSDCEQRRLASPAPPAKRPRAEQPDGGGGGAGAQQVISLLDASSSDEEGATEVRQQQQVRRVAHAAAAKAAPPSSVPAWLRQSGARRIMSELKSLQGTLDQRPGSLGPLRSVWLPDEDCISTWRMELRGFDEVCQPRVCEICMPCAASCDHLNVPVWIGGGGGGGSRTWRGGTHSIVTCSSWPRRRAGRSPRW